MSGREGERKEGSNDVGKEIGRKEKIMDKRNKGQKEETYMA